MPQQINSTHSCLRFMLILAQSFGMIPVTRVVKPTHSSLKFKWNSKYTIVAINFALLSFLNCLCWIINIFKAEKLSLEHFVTLSFFLFGFCTYVYFFELGRHWPYLMRKWAQVDKAMLSYGFPKNLNKKLKIITICIISSATIEHGLFLAVEFKSYKHGSVWTKINNYLENHFIYIFKIIPYNLVFGIFVEIFNIYLTFAWNFMDLFIIIISLTLSSRFTQIVEKIENYANLMVVNIENWQQVREDYNRLSLLCIHLNDTISSIILLSFSNNLFIVVVQLYNSLKPSEVYSVIHRIYFIYSFGFLILRTVAVSLYAATIENESKKPALILNTLPSYIHNIEIERLLDQVKYDYSVLNGQKLFKVTRGLLMHVAGAIVTYVLILAQLNS